MVSRLAPQTIWPIIAARELSRKDARLERQLADWCHIDVYALVKIWQGFAARNDVKV